MSFQSVFFTFGLLVSYTVIVNGMKSRLMDHLTETFGSQWIGAAVTSLQDGISCICVVIAYLISEAYTGPFTVVAFCSSASTMGLMLFWISSLPTSKLGYDISLTCIAIFLITLGNPGKKMSSELKMDSKEMQSCAITLLNIFQFSIASVMVLCLSLVAPDEQSATKLATLLMLMSYLIFYIGYCWYSHENLPLESNLGKIYRVCKLAHRKPKFTYPISENDYYWKNYKKNHLDYANASGPMLLPRVPPFFRWLEKASIIKEQPANYDLRPLTQEMVGEICTVKEVREMKSLALLFSWGFTFLAYNLISASGETFFIAQTDNLREFTTSDISILFLLKDSIGNVFVPIFSLLFGIAYKRIGSPEMGFLGLKRTYATILNISIGMVCALICCILAWHVEVRRLHLIKTEKILDNPDKIISMSTKALVPQFLVLGLSECLVEDGLEALFHAYTSESMSTFNESFSELVTGTGKLLTIPVILSARSWIKESANTSQLDRYYLLLAALNFMFLILFGLYYFKYGYKNEYPEDEETRMDQTSKETLNFVFLILFGLYCFKYGYKNEYLGMDQTPEHVHHAESGETNASSENLSTGEGSTVSEEYDEEIVVNKSLELAYQDDPEETNVAEVVVKIDRVGPMISEEDECNRAKIYRTWYSSRLRRSVHKRRDFRISDEPAIMEDDPHQENNDQHI